jgi:hypothetical protein
VAKESFLRPGVMTTISVSAGLLIGWVTLIVIFAAWCVGAAALNPGFGPELGPMGSFLVFSVVLSLYFVPGFLVFGCPGVVIARRVWGVAGPFRLAVCGATAVALGVVVADAVWRPGSAADTLATVALVYLPAIVGFRVPLAVDAHPSHGAEA